MSLHASRLLAACIPAFSLNKAQRYGKHAPASAPSPHLPCLAVQRARQRPRRFPLCGPGGAGGLLPALQQPVGGVCADRGRAGRRPCLPLQPRQVGWEPVWRCSLLPALQAAALPCLAPTHICHSSALPCLCRLGNAFTLWLGINPPELFFYAFLPPLLLDSALSIDYFLFNKAGDAGLLGLLAGLPCWAAAMPACWAGWQTGWRACQLTVLAPVHTSASRAACPMQIHTGHAVSSSPTARYCCPLLLPPPPAGHAASDGVCLPSGAPLLLPGHPCPAVRPGPGRPRLALAARRAVQVWGLSGWGSHPCAPCPLSLDALLLLDHIPHPATPLPCCQRPSSALSCFPPSPPLLFFAVLLAAPCWHQLTPWPSQLCCAGLEGPSPWSL